MKMNQIKQILWVTSVRKQLFDKSSDESLRRGEEQYPPCTISIEVTYNSNIQSRKLQIKL